MASPVKSRRRLPSGAEQPTRQKQRLQSTKKSSTADAGAEQPAPTALATIAECATWLSTLQTHLADEPTRRVAAAITALQAPISRAQRTEIQGLLKPWGVKQKSQAGAKIQASQIRSSLEAKVLEEARRVKTLHDSRSCSSAIATSLQMAASPFKE